MAGETLGEVIRRLGRCGGLQSDLAQSDAQLLDRFARRRDEPAFAALVARHGPMVLGHCRRLLHEPHDAEDAFQAVFLVLARKAGAIQRQTLLGPWLYGVAWRVAVRLRVRAARRNERETPGVDLDGLPADDAAWSEARWVVHEEVQRLPDIYRRAVVLCCLEGKTNEEAARLLSRPVGTVKSRLTRARELLRSRLARRGMTASVGALATALALRAAPASAALANAAVRAALPFAAGGAAAGGIASARAVALSQGVLRAMMLKKTTFAAALLVAAVLIGGGSLAYRPWAGAQSAAPHVVKATADKPAAADAPKDDSEAIQGTWKVASIQVKGKEWDDDEGRKQKTGIWTISADKMTLRIDSPQRHEMSDYVYTLDPTRTPKALDVSPWDRAAGVKGQSIPEVYSLDGDTLKICNGLAPSRERPKEVASKEGSQTVLFTLKRAPPDKDKDKEDAAALEGVWRVAAMETEGVERDDAVAKDVKKETWTIRGDKLVVHIEAPGPARDAKFTYSTDATRTPKSMDLTSEQAAEPSPLKNLHGVYSVDGDVLKFCYAMTGAEVEWWYENVGKPREGIRDINVLLPAGPRPSEVATKDGSKTTLLTLKREKADAPKDKPKADADDKSALKGTWRVISVEVGGKDATGGRADQERKAEWVVKDGFIGLQSKDPNFVPLSEVFAVRPDKNPKEIDINPYPIGAFVKTDVVEGIYALDGDVWKVCLAKWPMDPDDARRPTEMATKEGAKTVLITLKRVADEQSGPAADKPKPSPGDAPTPTGPVSEKEQKLLEDWSDAAKKAFDMRKEQFISGKIFAEPVMAAAHRLLTADVERSKTKADRVAAYKAHLDRIMDVLKIVRLQASAKVLSPADVAEAEYYRIEAEILLERETAK